MTKALFSFLAILISLTSLSKDNTTFSWSAGEVHLKNGETKKGEVKVRSAVVPAFAKGSHVVLFRSTSDSKKEKYKYDDVERVIVYDSTENEEYVFYKRKKKKYQFFRILVDGDVELLGTTMKINVGAGGGGTHITGMPTGTGGFYTPIFIPPTYSSNWFKFNSYYVKKESEDMASPLIEPKISKPFKAKAKEYFKDCDSIIKKLEDKTYNRKNLDEMVKDYNDGC